MRTGSNLEVLDKEGGGGDHLSVAWGTDPAATPTSADIVPAQAGL